MIRPAEIDFGPDPEARRAAAGRNARRTISKREDEFSVTPQTSLNPSDPIYIEPSDPVDGGYDLQFDHAYCRTSEGDTDGDGLRDSCESSLAHAFRPYLRIQSSDTCPTREPYWSAAPEPSLYQGVKIFYLLSYYHDCARGSIGGIGGAHYGDSEFIIVVVRNFGGTTHWALESATLSAHHGTVTQGTQTLPYNSSKLTYPDQWRGAPLSWVALDKHGNFPTRDDCEAGGAGYDTCTYSYFDTRVDVLSSANIGNSTKVSPNAVYLINWSYSRAGQPGVEYFWPPLTGFCGWQDTSDPTGPGYPWVTYDSCAGGYGTLLSDYSF